MLEEDCDLGETEVLYLVFGSVRGNVSASAHSYLENLNFEVVFGSGKEANIHSAQIEAGMLS